MYNPNDIGRRPILPYLQAVYRSFYSDALYRDILNKEPGSPTPVKGLGFRYLIMIVGTVSLLLAMLLFTSISTLSPSQGASFFVKSTRIEPKMPLLQEWNILLNRLANVPSVQIKDGQLYTPKQQPYYIKDKSHKTTAQLALEVEKKTPNYFMVIDTTGKYRTLKEADAAYLITDREIIDQGSRLTLTEALGSVSESKANYFLEFLGRIPELSFSKGLLSMPNEDSPYRIPFPKEKDDSKEAEDGVIVQKGEQMLSDDKTLVIIDVKGNITSLNHEENAVALLTEDELIVRVGSDIHALVWELASNDTYRDLIEGVLSSVKGYALWAVVMLFFFIVALGSAVMIGVALLLGLFAQALGKVWHVQGADYPDYVRLASVALTPMMLLAVIFFTSIGSSGLILCVIASGYTCFAVYANRPEFVKGNNENLKG